MVRQKGRSRGGGVWVWTGSESDQPCRPEDRGGRCLQRAKPCGVGWSKVIGMILGSEDGPRVGAVASRRAVSVLDWTCGEWRAGSSG